jgi:hypothetical protein
MLDIERCHLCGRATASPGPLPVCLMCQWHGAPAPVAPVPVASDPLAGFTPDERRAAIFLQTEVRRGRLGGPTDAPAV